jgi:hypothetical protein
VAAGAERAARVDDDRLRVGRRLFPGRPDPQLSDTHRPVEIAPAFLPAARNVLGGDLAERGPEPLLAGVVGVGDQLEAVRVVELLESLREELEHQRAGLLGAFSGNRRGDPAQAQRNALFSFWKNPSSASYVSGAGAAVEILQEAALLLGQATRAPAR